MWISSRRLLEKLAILAAIVLATASALAMFARFGWFPELFSHFPLQYALGSLFLGLIFLLLGRRKLALLVAVVLAAPNLWYVAPYLLPVLVPASVAESKGQDVAVISINLYYRSNHYPAVRDYLRSSGADLLVLSELTPEWATELRPVTADYPYWMSLNRHTPWGLGVFSRYPLLNARATDLGVPGSVNVVATVALPGGDVQLVAVHLVSPSSPGRGAMRNRQLAELAALLGPPSMSDAGRPPRLLVGDLNLTPFSPYFTDLLAQTGLVDARRPHGLHGTWPTWMLPLQIAIDHCIAEPGLGVTRVARGPAIGSDHYPLEITVRQRG